MKQEFLQAIEACKDGTERYQHMLIYADYLEERGEKEHEGWRWVASNKITPFRYGLYIWTIWRCGNGIPIDRKIAPNEARYTYNGIAYLSYEIPDNIWQEIYSLKIPSNYPSAKDGNSRVEVEEAIAKAYVRVVK